MAALAGMLCALLAAACGHVGPLAPPEGGNGTEAAPNGSGY